MGLLDQILGGLGGGGLGRSPMGQSGAGGGGMGGVVMALLPVVLGMLSNRSGGASRADGGMLGGLGSQMNAGGLGGMAGGGMGGLGGAMGGMGGLGGLLEQLTQRGYGRQAQSWVSTGENEPIDPNAMSEVFGNDQISRIASQAGVSEEEARGGLAELLPNVVDHFTPDGKVPDLDQLAASVDDYQRRVGS